MKPQADIAFIRRDDPLSQSVSLVGMAGAGKSTLAPLLAEALGYAHMDTDRLLEAEYGQPLQALLDAVGLDVFLCIEEHHICALAMHRCVISTGGSVIYSEKAIGRLKALGPVVFLEVDQENVLARVGAGRNRGLAIGPGKTLAELFAERQPLYRAAADITVSTTARTPESCVAEILDLLKKKG